MSELNNPAVVATVAMQVDGEGTSSADGAIDAGDRAGHPVESEAAQL